MLCLTAFRPLNKTTSPRLALSIDEITCSTIHGFCQRLIKPYPAEADIDPGAGVMDRNQADLTFLEITDAWLRERLSGGQDGILAEMVLLQPRPKPSRSSTRLPRTCAGVATLSPPPASPIDGHLQSFRQATTAFAAFMQSAPAVEPETAAIVERLHEMAAALDKAPDPANACRDWSGSSSSRPHSESLHQGRRFRVLPEERQMDRRRQASRPLPKPMAIG